MRSIPILVVVASAFPSSLFAHEALTGWKYEAFCCNGNEHNGDCQMISTKNVRVTPQGYDISLRPGEHRLVTRRHDFSVPQSQTRRSGDEEYHLCLYPDEDTLRCFYAPDMAY
jgi:hypothetical protein